MQENTSRKRPRIEDILTAITGQDLTACIQNHKCMTCGCDADNFRNEISKDEFHITGMCQKCQDSIFGEEENEK